MPMRWLSSGLIFIAVGLSAACVHFGTFWTLTRIGTIQPLLANALAFVVAFGVSFLGHHKLTFSDHDQTWLTSLRRFGVTALLGLITSEITLAMVWRILAWPDWLGVLIGQGIAAVQTFALGRWWAFARSGHQPQSTP